MQFGALRLRADWDIVFKAVSNSWEALQWASAELRADREMVLKAVSQSWEALQYATDELRGDTEIIARANFGEGEGLVLSLAAKPYTTSDQLQGVSGPVGPKFQKVSTLLESSQKSLHT